MSDLPDAELLAHWCSGDRDAFAVLVSRHYGLVQAACRRQAASGEDEDCAQAVFLILARKPHAAARAPALAAWLQRTAWFVCEHARRSARRRQRVEQAAIVPVDDTTAAPSEALVHLDGCLRKLPEKQRVAVTLHYLSSKTPEEVATALHIERNHAYQLISRGLAGLRVLLARRGVVVAEVGLVSLLAAEADAATASAPTAAIASLSGTPSASAAALATGAVKAMTIAALTPIAVAAGLVLAAGTLSLALTAEAVAPSPPPPAPAGTSVVGSPLVADVIVTPRTSDAALVFREIHRKGGPKVAVCCDTRLRVPWDMRFSPVAGRQLIAAVAATQNMKIAWVQDGRCAILYVGAPDADVERLKNDLVSTDATIRRDAAWRGKWLPDLRIIPSLVTAARDTDVETARQAMGCLRRLNWSTVVTVDPSAVSLLLADLGNSDSNVREYAMLELPFVDREKALAILEKARADQDTDVRRLANFYALDDVGEEKALAILAKTLSGQDTDLRKAATYALGELGGEKALALLEKAFADQDASVRSTACSELGRVGGEKSLAILEKTLAGQDANLREVACRALGNVGGEKALALLEKALAGQDTDLRRAAAYALGQVGGEKALALLEKALADQDAWVRSSACRALGDVGGGKALTLLVKTLANQDDYLRTAASQTLGEMGGEEVLAILEKALAGQDANLRSAACIALANVGGEKTLPILEKTLTGQDTHLREVACECLINVGGEKALALLEKVLAGQDTNLRLSACRALGSLGGEKVLALLEKALADQDANVRGSVCRALHDVYGEEALTLLEKALADPNASVRTQAYEALLWHMDKVKALALLEKTLFDQHGSGRGSVYPALGEMGGVKATALKVLAGQDARVRRSANWALAGFHSEQACEALVKHLAKESDAQVRAIISGNLKQAFPNDPLVKKAIEAAEKPVPSQDAGHNNF